MVSDLLTIKTKILANDSIHNVSFPGFRRYKHAGVDDFEE